MSLIAGNSMLITCVETEVLCPICGQTFDAGPLMGRSKYPLFNTKCPRCRGGITIHEPLFGGRTECWETAHSPNVKRLHSLSPRKVNGVVVEPATMEEA